MTVTAVIAVDAMGGDLGTTATIPAVVDFLSGNPDVQILLFGNESDLRGQLRDRRGHVPSERLQLIDCPQRVESGDRPARALRHKRESSMWRALAAVAEGRASACVSAGETGTLMAMGTAVLGTLPGIERPAICTALPAISGRVYLLDLGANVDCDGDTLHQFARMGVARLQVAEQLRTPRVALLNIGAEAGKGNRAVKAAAELLAADATLNYVGFVEGDGLLRGQADLVVCDGFVGNVALKAMEGTARLVVEQLRATGRSRSRWRSWVARPLFKSALGFLDPGQYNGASMLGLRGVVVKSHGSADSAGFGHALTVALTEARGGLPERIAARLAAVTSS
ncbi:MAG: phosphate acyltransferase PlsX [Porticoccaceae bacterium]